MPKEGISLYFTVKDGASPTLTTLGDKTQALDKDTEELAQAYSTLQKANAPLIQRQAELQKSLSEIKTRIKDTKRAWEEYGDEEERVNHNALIEEQAELQAKLKDVNDQLRLNQKTFNEYREDLRKGGLAEDGGTTLGDNSGSLLTAIVGGQIGQMLSNSLGGAAQTLFTSAVGTPTANLASEVVSSAIQGAMIGTALAPGLGTAIGAGVGALSGALTGEMQIYEQKDDAFKDYYSSPSNASPKSPRSAAALMRTVFMSFVLSPRHADRSADWLNVEADAKQ